VSESIPLLGITTLGYGFERNPFQFTAQVPGQCRDIGITAFGDIGCLWAQLGQSRVLGVL